MMMMMMMLSFSLTPRERYIGFRNYIYLYVRKIGFRVSNRETFSKPDSKAIMRASNASVKQVTCFVLHNMSVINWKASRGDFNANIHRKQCPDGSYTI